MAVEPTQAVESEADLLALMRAGEPAAFATLMRRNNQRLYRLARGVLDSESEAEDVLQESYLRAFTHLDGFKGEASLATWLARIVLNEALGRLRRRHPTVDLADMAETLAADHDAVPPPLNEPTPEQAIARREIRRAVETAINALPPAFRSVFILRALEQLSVAETAASLGIPQETVKTRFHRANKLLRHSLSRHFGAIVEGAFPFLGTRCDRLVESVLGRLGGTNASAASLRDRPPPSPP